ncbi:hypothetical protein JIP1097_20073 [Tenacibaculum maritimum]|nr:RHS repeat-associated core domain-containing protein [Tenacibaculum maritimum]CAA0186202.1 hypothetical protein JIP1097_20073 [Tenacibaculum maritimum]
MYDEEGEQVWERSLDLNGKVINGSNAPCPFLYQGQYYDKEIELAYNRFRYYDPDDGRYISKDPIGLLSGEYGFYNYVGDSNGWIDPLGLAKTYGKKKKNPLSNKEKDKFRKAEQDIKDGNGVPRRNRDGSQTIFEKRKGKPHQDKWDGSKEFEVEERNNKYRILERTRETRSGETIVDYGYTSNHYDNIVTDIDKLYQA